LFWEEDTFNSVLFENKRATCGKKILTGLAAKLLAKYGNSKTCLLQISSPSILFQMILLLVAG
jgi:hypothetical protein